MALVEVKVPQLSESVAEATLLQWHKKAGDSVARDENLIDVETDKVVLELPAPVAGVLTQVIKSDGGREAFDARKLRTSFDRALQKRPVAEEQIEAAVRAVVHQLRMSGERELPSIRVGEYVMAELRKLDHVGYVRFASVYRSFQDVADFREEIEKLERELPVGSEQLPLLDLVRAAKPGDKTGKR